MTRRMLRIGMLVMATGIVCGAAVHEARALDRPMWTTLNFQDGTLVVESGPGGLYLHFLVYPFQQQHDTWVPAGKLEPGFRHRPPSALQGLGSSLRIFAIKPDNTVIEHSFDTIVAVERRPYYMKLTFTPIEEAERSLEIICVPERPVVLFRYDSEGLADYKLRIEMDGTPGRVEYPNPLTGNMHSLGEGAWTWYAREDTLLHTYGSEIDRHHNPVGALFQLLRGDEAGLFDRSTPTIERWQFVFDDGDRKGLLSNGPMRCGQASFMMEYAIRFKDSAEFGVAFGDSRSRVIDFIQEFRPATRPDQTPMADSGGGPLGMPHMQQMANRAAEGQAPDVNSWISFTQGLWLNHMGAVQRLIAADENLRTDFRHRMVMDEVDMFTAAMTELSTRLQSNGLLSPRPPAQTRPLQSPPFDLRAQAVASVVLSRAGLAEHYGTPFVRTMLASTAKHEGPRPVVLNDRDLPALLEGREPLLASWPSDQPIAATSVAALAKWIEDGGQLVLFGGTQEFLPGDGWWKRANPSYQGPQDALLAQLDWALGPATGYGAGGGMVGADTTVLSRGQGHGAREPVTVDLSPQFEEAGLIYLVIEQGNPAVEASLVLHEATLHTQVMGATREIRWRPGTNDEGLYLSASEGARIEPDSTGVHANRVMEPGAFVVYRLEAERGAPLRASLTLTGPYRILAARSAPRTSLPVAFGGGDASPVEIPTRYRPVYFHTAGEDVLARPIGESGALAVGRRSGRGYLALVGVPATFLAFDPQASAFADAILDQTPNARRAREHYLSGLPYWLESFTDGSWESGDAPQPPPDVAPMAVWALHALWQKNPQTPLLHREAVLTLHSAMHGTRYSDAFDPQLGLMTRRVGGMGWRAPSGGEVHSAATLELNALWYGAAKMLSAMAGAARERDVQRWCDDLASSLQSAMRARLWQGNLGMYRGGMLRLANGTLEPCPLDWSATRDETAVTLCLLTGDVAPWKPEERLLMVGHLLSTPAADSPIARAALAGVATRQQEPLLRRMVEEMNAPRPLTEPMFLYPSLPTMLRDGVRGPDIQLVALSAYALCIAKPEQ